MSELTHPRTELSIGLEISRLAAVHLRRSKKTPLEDTGPAAT